MSSKKNTLKRKVTRSTAMKGTLERGKERQGLKTVDDRGWIEVTGAGDSQNGTEKHEKKEKKGSH
jgi:hypothetical protein